jgi:hypothetical protein
VDPVGVATMTASAEPFSLRRRTVSGFRWLSDVWFAGAQLRLRRSGSCHAEEGAYPGDDRAAERDRGKGAQKAAVE